MRRPRGLLARCAAVLRADLRAATLLDLRRFSAAPEASYDSEDAVVAKGARELGLDGVPLRDLKGEAGGSQARRSHESPMPFTCPHCLTFALATSWGELSPLAALARPWWRCACWPIRPMTP